MQKILMIGVGSMDGAILQRALEQGVWGPEEVDVLVRRSEQASELERTLGVTAFTDCDAIPAFDEYRTIVFGVKPQVLPSLMEEVGPQIEARTLCISIAAGITLDTLQSFAPHVHWLRAMPNTPILVKAGFTAIASSEQVTPGEREQALRIFEALGEAVVCSEADLDRIGALAGAGPGYMYTILDAMANAGVRIGLTRPLALQAAVQTMYGSGLIALETGAHPSVLRDQVTSPGGTTIAGIAAMEKEGLRSSIMEGILACYERSNEIGKQRER